MKISFLCTSLAIVMYLLTLTACSEQQVYPVKTPLVAVYKIPKKNNQNIQKFPAIVSASDLTKLSFRVNGELISIPVYSGQKIKKNELIAKIDPINFALAVKDKKAKVVLAKKSMERTKAMVELGNMAKNVFDQLEAKYRVAQSQYELALLQLSYVELRAPFDGVIASVPADNFQNTSIGQLVATMHRVDKIEIRVDLPDIIVAAAKADNEKKYQLSLNVTLDAYPEHIFKASYKEHTTEQTDENKQYMLILEMPVDKSRLALQGMPGNVEIDLATLNVKKSSVTSMPIEAVILPDYLSVNDDVRIVWRVNKAMVVEPVEVQTVGLDSISFINVSGHLNEGDQIVVKGMRYLREGLKVDVYQQGDTVQ